MSNTFESGDVLWAPDPYNAGDNPRPWLVLTGAGLPYAGEEYICAGLTLSNLPDNVELTANDWVAGNEPDRTSYCSPWVLATIKHDAIANPQGYVTPEFTAKIARRSIAYLASDVAIDG